MARKSNAYNPKTQGARGQVKAVRGKASRKIAMDV